MGYELLRQVRLLDPVAELDQRCDLLLEDGWIRSMAPNLDTWPETCKVREAAGWILGPGLVDLYSQAGEPGQEERESLDSLAAAALAGGFTRVLVLPNTTPARDTAPVLRDYCQRSWPLQLDFWGALTRSCAGEALTELADLQAAGAVGFSDGMSLPSWMLLRRLLEYAKPLQRAIALWPRHSGLAGKGTGREGGLALQLGLPPDSALSETVAIAGLLELVRATGTPIHLMRLSTARGVELLRQAREADLPVTASTTWLHLLYTTADLANYDPNLRLSPPLGNASDRAALREAVQAGMIGAIAVDHAPYTYEEKTVAFGETPPGALGLELALPMLWQALVVEAGWSPLALWRALSSGPQHCLQEKPQGLGPGSTQLTLFDPQAGWRVDETTLQSRSCNTHLLGQHLTGHVLKTYIGGR
jgi:dihydroorotase